MNPTSRMTHFRNGSNSVLGLPIFTDDADEEFVNYQNQWVHVSEVPLERAHTVEMSYGPISPKRVPQFIISPAAPQVDAFNSPTVQQPPPKPLFDLDEQGRFVKL